MSDVIVIGVAGGTGSGKTTLVKALVNRFGDNITVLSHDNYYKRHDELTYEERTKLNYDHPNAFDTDMMIEHLQQLREGHAIECPTYDYTIHNRAAETITIEPRKVIVVEGILILRAGSFAIRWTSKSSLTRTWMCACAVESGATSKSAVGPLTPSSSSTSRRSSPCTSSSSSPARKTRTSLFPRAARTSSRWK